MTTHYNGIAAYCAWQERRQESRQELQAMLSRGPVYWIAEDGVVRRLKLNVPQRREMRFRADDGGQWTSWVRDPRYIQRQKQLNERYSQLLGEIKPLPNPVVADERGRFPSYLKRPFLLPTP